MKYRELHTQKHKYIKYTKLKHILKRASAEAIMHMMLWYLYKYLKPSVYMSVSEFVCNQ